MHPLISEEEYRICLKNLPIVTVDLLIFNAKKDEILLLKRKNNPLKGVFYSPGGRVLKNETVIQAMLRKAKEELNLDLNASDLTPGWVVDEIFDESIYDGINTHCTNVYFGYITKVELNIQLDSQHDDFKWFSVADKDLHPYLKTKINTLLPKL